MIDFSGKIYWRPVKCVDRSSCITKLLCLALSVIHSENPLFLSYCQSGGKNCEFIFVTLKIYLLDLTMYKELTIMMYIYLKVHQNITRLIDFLLKSHFLLLSDPSNFTQLCEWDLWLFAVKSFQFWHVTVKQGTTFFLFISDILISNVLVFKDKKILKFLSKNMPKEPR